MIENTCFMQNVLGITYTSSYGIIYHSYEADLVLWNNLPSVVKIIYIYCNYLFIFRVVLIKFWFLIGYMHMLMELCVP